MTTTTESKKRIGNPPLTVFSMMPEEHRYNNKYMSDIGTLVSSAHYQIFHERAKMETHVFEDKGVKKKVKLRVYRKGFEPIIKNCITDYFKKLTIK